MLTTPQLRRICAFTSDKVANDHARPLFDAGYLDRPKVPLSVLDPEAPVYGGKPTLVHVITRRGLRYLYEGGFIGEETASRKIPEFSETNAIFLRHELLVRDVRVWLSLLTRAYEGHEVTSWKDGPDALLPGVLPDAAFSYRMGAGELSSAVEADRGTERSVRSSEDWGRKTREYGALFSSGSSPVVRVIAVTLNSPRRDRLADMVAGFAPDEALRRRFFFAERAALETPDLLAPVWRVPGRDQLLPLVPESAL